MTLCNHFRRVEIVLVPAEWQAFLSTEKDMKAVLLVMFLKRGQWVCVCILETYEIRLPNACISSPRFCHLQPAVSSSAVTDVDWCQRPIPREKRKLS